MSTAKKLGDVAAPARVVNEPMVSHRRRAIRVEIAPLASGDRDLIARSFWLGVGDLIADTLVDTVDAAWGSAPPAKSEMLAS
jgi:hypothetical protein